MLVMNLVIGAAACASVVGSVLDEDPETRHDKELARIARASLFLPPNPQNLRMKR
ncbi:MAG TPA: hypothetical protein PK156_40355 [Polyangium sp.]|nr:hypothetical protein [Polyangium sp.]